MNDDEMVLSIAIALNEMTREQWGDMGRDKHGPALQRLALRDARSALPIVTAEVRKGQAEAWDGACRAFAWCRDNGPIEDALPYVAEHNPYADKEADQ